jgi:hypothetical protein
MAIEGEQFKGDCVALEVIFHMPPEHDPHLKVFLVRWNGEEDLRVVIHAVSVIMHLGVVV